MKTTEQYFQEFYNEIRYQIEQGDKADFTRANQIWVEYEQAKRLSVTEYEVISKNFNCRWCGIVNKINVPVRIK